MCPPQEPDMARFSRLILLTLLALTFSQTVPVCSSAGGRVQSKNLGEKDRPRRRLPDEVKRPRNSTAALHAQLVTRQFHVDTNSVESDGGTRSRGSQGQKVSPQMRAAMRETALRVKYLKNIIDGNRFGASEDEATAGGKADTIADPQFGQYLVKIGLGQPPQQLDLALDTASRWLWVCEGSECYNSSASSTCSDVKCWDSGCQTFDGTCQDGNCRYDYQLSDGSNSGGRVVSDCASISSGLVISSLLFGISDTSSGYDGVAGVLGLGRSASSFTSQLEANSDISSSFAHCLPPWDASSSETGAIYFGAWESSDGDESELVFTPLLSNDKNPDFYYVQLDSIEVAGNTLDIPEGTFDIDPDSGYKGFFFDSGVTFTQLTSDAYYALLNEMKKGVIYPGVQVTNGLELCYDTSTAVGEPWFPSLTFVFGGGQQMNLPTDNVFVKVDQDNDNIRCLGVQETDKFNILGSFQQQKFLIVYDMENLQVGWGGPVHCVTDDGD